MAKIKMKIERDANEIKYISILRKEVNKSISEIKKLISNNDYILSYNLLDMDEMIEIEKIVSLLLKADAKVHLYENNREVSIEFLNNLIESYQDTENYMEEIDEQMDKY
ncbi:hypothetical protein GKZ89_09735 [Bacillus mangrovi]|uniref:Uncharacterized protein n=1 Tax=Metabacillus mangrovi TaxID=1491830 RepID=A0A7X2V551_9BACI|nr:hypothetical protein [Metabacillus mangrovi]MTH53683.1 hypothetical protein [Metabacillus mangrovi]